MTLVIVAILSAAGLLLTWLAYPVAMQLLASRGKPALSGPDATRPTVSVIIATRDSAESVSRRVENLFESAYPSELMEVVIGVDATAPGLALEPHPRVRVVAGDAPGGKSATLNAAVRHANGAVLVFTDSAQSFEPDTISRMVGSLRADERLGAVSGALHLDGGASPAAALYWRFERSLRHAESRVHSTVGVTGAVYAMHRALWSPLPTGLILDDLWVPMQLVLRGYRVGFDERAIAHDARQFSESQEYQRKLRTLTGVLQLCAWFPATLSLSRNPIFTQFLFHKVLRLLTPYLAALLAVSSLWLLVTRVPPPLGTQLLAALGAAAIVPLVLSRRVRRLVKGVLLLQAAAARASLHAMRGDWNVWQR